MGRKRIKKEVKRIQRCVIRATDSEWKKIKGNAFGSKSVNDFMVKKAIECN